MPKKITVVDIKNDENADIVDSNEVTIPEGQPVIEENNIKTQDKPVEDKPVEEKTIEDKPVEEKTVEEIIPVEEKCTY